MKQVRFKGTKSDFFSEKSLDVKLKFLNSYSKKEKGFNTVVRGEKNPRKKNSESKLHFSSEFSQKTYLFYQNSQIKYRARTQIFPDLHVAVILFHVYVTHF